MTLTVDIFISPLTAASRHPVFPNLYKAERDFILVCFLYLMHILYLSWLGTWQIVLSLGEGEPVGERGSPRPSLSSPNSCLGHVSPYQQGWESEERT